MSTLFATPVTPRRIEQYSSLRMLAAAELDARESLARRDLLAWQREALAAQLDYARTHSPFYRDRLSTPVQDPAADGRYACLPFTTKDDLRANYPLGMIAVPLSKLARYGASTGTSGW